VVPNATALKTTMLRDDDVAGAISPAAAGAPGAAAEVSGEADFRTAQTNW